ncbi:MAG: hypothetical protein NZ750_05035 [Anaerolineae bacterium]|nr:hypothetical protein [Anaerolineae bacterium]MDW8172142.1 hypothetical protein [Anaerolineae bacterium]
MSDRLRQRMQESLDGALSEAMKADLMASLARDRDAAAEYDRLTQVDHLLSRAPTVRAPQRLAAAIMARLAQTVARQAKLDALPEEVQRAIMLSLGMILNSLRPALVAASWLVLNAQRDPTILTEVVLSSLGVMKITIDALLMVLDEIERLLEDDPERAALGAVLVPSLLLAMLDMLEATEDKLR